MSKVAIVARREFVSTVRRRSYLIVTLGMPFFLTAYMGLVGLLPAYVLSRSGRSAKPSGVVDLAGIVRPELLAVAVGAGAAPAIPPHARELVDRLAPPTSKPILGALLDDDDSAQPPAPFVLQPSKDEALDRLRHGDLQRVFVIPADYLAQGGIETYQTDTSPFGKGGERSRDALTRVLRRSLLADRVPAGMTDRVERPIDPMASTAFVVHPSGRVEPLMDAERIARMVIPGVFALLLLTSLVTSAGYLLQGVVEEKENRVIEVILSSVTPRDLLLGKLFGLGAAGLLQLAVWVSVASFATSLIAAAALAYLNWILFLFCGLAFIGGYLLVGSLMTGTGALGSNARESQQLSVIWTVCLVIPPLMTWMLIVDEPNSAMARALSWFPLTGPITLMVRLGTGKVPIWDATLAVLLLFAGVYVAIRVAAALFRLGLLLYGKRPTLREIVRQLRNA